MSEQIIVVASDASSRDGGGWGWARPDGTVGFGSVGKPYLHIDELELIAMYKALCATPKGSTVHILTDSRVALARIAHAVEVTSPELLPVPGRLRVEYAHQFNQVAATRTVVAHWVRGHAGHPLNHAADRLAHAITSRPDLMVMRVERVKRRLRDGAAAALAVRCECGAAVSGG